MGEFKLIEKWIINCLYLCIMLKMYNNLSWYKKVIICNFSKYPQFFIIGPEYTVIMN